MKFHNRLLTTMVICLFYLTACASDADDGSKETTQSDTAESACEEMMALLLAYPVDETEYIDELEPCVTPEHLDCEAALACVPDDIVNGYQVMDCLTGAMHCAATQCDTTLSCLTDEFASGENDILDALSANFGETCLAASVHTGPAANGEERQWEITACHAGTCITEKEIASVICK